MRPTLPIQKKATAFTLIELLIVLAIVIALFATLFPVFTSVRENGRRASCLSNERQLGMSMYQYVSDDNETLPSGVVFAGDKWVSQVYPYVRSTAVFHCPDDGSSVNDTNNPTGGFPVGYGLNSNLGRRDTTKGSDGEVTNHSEGKSLVALTEASRSVMLFEVSKGGVAISKKPNATDGSTSGDAGDDGIAYSDGSGGTLTDPTYPLTSSIFGVVLYATGDVGGRLLNGATMNGRVIGPGSMAQHSGGANYVACDGHAVWLRPTAVSGGTNAIATDCSQGTDPKQPNDCTKQNSSKAAGTGNTNYTLTFSTE